MIAICGVVHYWWLVKKDITQPFIYGCALAALLAFRAAQAIVHSGRGGAGIGEFGHCGYNQRGENICRRSALMKCRSATSAAGRTLPDRCPVFPAFTAALD